jgi:hypothetical protein
MITEQAGTSAPTIASDDNLDSQLRQRNLSRGRWIMGIAME